MNTRLVLMHALSPLHCGTGQAVGGIDLPIAREKPTNLPLVPGSSLKGVLRAKAKCEGLHKEAFGPETMEASEHAGAVQFGDLHLLFLPVRSVKGTFAYVTSPYLLRRLQRDAKEAGLKFPELPALDFKENTRAYVNAQTLVVDGKGVVFEDVAFSMTVDDAFKGVCTEVANRLFDAAADRALLVNRACLVSDDVMSILLDSATELTTRNKLDADTKTVANGQLWTEESLPVESILVGLITATPVGGRSATAAELLGHVEKLARDRGLQIGGKASVGRGLVQLRLASQGGL